METIKVIIRNKVEILHESECHSVSMLNKVGPFDILPEHSNFVSIISGEVIARNTSGKVWQKNCTRGIVRVESNTVEVIFLEEVL